MPNLNTLGDYQNLVKNTALEGLEKENKLNDLKNYVLPRLLGQAADLLEGMDENEQLMFANLAKAAGDSLGEDNVGRSAMNYPADPNVILNNAQVDMNNKFSEVDVAVAARVEKITSLRAYMTPDTRQNVDDVINSRNFQGAMEEYTRLGQMVRRMDRMLQICGDDPQLANIKNKLITARTRMISPEAKTEPMKKLDTVLEGLEVLAGMKDVSLPPEAPKEDSPDRALYDQCVAERQRLSDGLRWTIDRDVPLKWGVRMPAPGKRSMTNEVEVPLPGRENLIRSIRYNQVSNWGRPVAEWQPLPREDEPQAEGYFRAMRLYAESIGKNYLDPLLERIGPKKDLNNSHNPLDLVIVGTLTVRQMMERRRDNQDITPEEFDRAVNDYGTALSYARFYVAAGVVDQMPVTVLASRRIEGIGENQAIHLRSSANANAAPINANEEERPELSWWKKFAHWAFGAYKEDFDRLSRYDAQIAHNRQVSEAAAQLNRTTQEREEAARQAEQRRAEQERRKIQSRKNNHIALQHQQVEIELSRNRFMNAYGSNEYIRQNPMTDDPKAKSITDFRGQADSAKMKGLPQNSVYKVTEEGFAMLTFLGMLHYGNVGKMLGGEEHASLEGQTQVFAHLTEDVLIGRPMGRIPGSVLADANNVAFNALSNEDEMRNLMQNCLPFMVRHALRHSLGVSGHQSHMLDNCEIIYRMMENEPKLKELIPEDVRDGIGAIHTINQIRREAYSAKDQLLEKWNAPNARSLMVSALMESYVSSMLVGEDDRVETESPQMQNYRRQVDEMSAQYIALQKSGTEQQRAANLTEQSRLSKIGIQVESAAMATLPLSNNMRALAAPGFIDKLRTIIENSDYMKQLDAKVKSGETSYQNAMGEYVDKAAGAEGSHKKLKAELFDTLPTPETIKAELEASKNMGQPKAEQPDNDIANGPEPEVPVLGSEHSMKPKGMH